MFDHRRFCVHRVQNDQFDTVRVFDKGVLIDTYLLQRPYFAVDRWYWQNRTEALGRSPREVYRAELLRTDFTPPMETPLKDHVVFCLASGEVDDDFIRRMEEAVICNESSQSDLRETTPCPREILTSCNVDLSNADIDTGGGGGRRERRWR